MFRLMDTQISMDEAQFWMPDESREQLERTWPEVFRTQVLKMIPESAFPPCTTPFRADQISR